MTNSSYHTVARKVVQRRLGKSPVKSFVQELNLQEKKSQIKCRGINYSKKKINCLVLSNTALQLPLGLLKIIIITVIKNKKAEKKLTFGDLTNIGVQVSPTCTINTTKKHAPSAITVQLVDESRVVFTTWFPLSPFANSQRSSIHPGPIPGLFR